MAIDRADWHYGADYPERLPDENGGTHIGMYLNWMIDNNLISDFHLKDSKKEVEEVKSKKITGREFLFDCCDGKLQEGDLSEEGLKFTQFYYLAPHDAEGAYGTYLEDYQDLLIEPAFDSLYEVSNNWENYKKLASRIDERYKKWKSPGDKKPWLLWKK